MMSPQIFKKQKSNTYLAALNIIAFNYSKTYNCIHLHTSFADDNNDKNK